jgi:peptide deformylase
MAVLELVKAPDPRLKLVSQPIADVDTALRRFMDDMVETMYAESGIGLAAIQVGVPKRVAVINLDPGGPNSKQL